MPHIVNNGDIFRSECPDGSDEEKCEVGYWLRNIEYVQTSFPLVSYERHDAKICCNLVLVQMK